MPELRPLVWWVGDAYRLLGPARLCWIGPLWLLHPAYLVLVGQPVQLEMRASLPVRWAPLTNADLPRLTEVHPALSPAGARRRLAEGQTCLVGWVGQSIAHYRWDTSEPALLPHLNLVLRPARGDLLTVSAYTAPAFRGRGLHAASTALVLRQAAERGITRTVTLVAWWNRPALRVARDLAQRQCVGTVGWWSWPGGRRLFTTGAALDLSGGRQIQVR